MQDPRYATETARQENFGTGQALIQTAMKSRTTQKWLPILKQHGVAVQSVRNLDTALLDPQLAHRGILVDASGGGLDEKTDLIGVSRQAPDPAGGHARWTCPVDLQ